MTTTTTTPTDPAFYANHSDDALRSIVARYTQTSLATFTANPAILAEAMEIANVAFMVMASRGAA